nr:hypothetical protein Iba_chr03bCG17270 [Ipomoea batatas]GMC76157.1 hypothetical protein Iba_chr03dCG11650 [Ipomoea batatas]
MPVLFILKQSKSVILTICIMMVSFSVSPINSMCLSSSSPRKVVIA